MLNASEAAESLGLTYWQFREIAHQIPRVKLGKGLKNCKYVYSPAALAEFQAGKLILVPAGKPRGRKPATKTITKTKRIEGVLK